MKTEKDFAEIVLDLTKSKEERIQAAFHLENAVNDESIKNLCKGLMTDPSPIVRHEAILALATLNDKSVIPFIKNSLIQKSQK